MKHEVSLDRVYSPSKDIVARDVMGELIIVPLASGIGNTEDEIYTLNETGRAIWDRLDGRTTLQDIAKALSREFDAPPGEIERDVQGLIGELFHRRMVIAV